MMLQRDLSKGKVVRIIFFQFFMTFCHLCENFPEKQTASILHQWTHKIIEKLDENKRTIQWFPVQTKFKFDIFLWLHMWIKSFHT